MNSISLAPTLPHDAQGPLELRVDHRLYEYQWFRIGPLSGEPPRLGLVFRDVTDERRLQEKVIQAEKFSGLSLLASVLAGVEEISHLRTGLSPSPNLEFAQRSLLRIDFIFGSVYSPLRCSLAVRPPGKLLKMGRSAQLNIRWLIVLSAFLTAWFLPISSILSAQPDAAKRQYQQGLSLFRQGQYDEAAEASKKAISLQPQLAEAHHLLGLVLFEGKKEHVGAIEALKKAVQLNPNYPDAYYDLGRIYLSQAKYKEAEQALIRAIELAPQSEEARLALAKLYNRDGNPLKAIQTYQALLAFKPRHPEALYSLGRLYEAQGDARLARHTLQQLTQTDPSNADAWYLLGRLAEKENNLGEAAEAYKHAILAKPDLVDAHYNLGFLLRSAGKQEDATKQFLKVIEYRPEYAEAHMNLGMSYTALGLFDEAEQAYQKAIELKPNLPEAHYSLGVFYELHRKDSVRALIQYRKYLDLGGKDERVERIVQQGRR